MRTIYRFTKSGAPAELTALETFLAANFDHVQIFNDKYVLNRLSQKAAVGDEVKYVNALRGLPMHYAGDDPTQQSAVIPLLVSDVSGQGVRLNNEPNVQYQSEQRDSIYPCEIRMVISIGNYDESEAPANDQNFPYVGLSNGLFLRVRNNADFDGDQTWLTTLRLIPNAINEIRYQLFDDVTDPLYPNRVRVIPWVNGVSDTSKPYNTQKRNPIVCGIGAYTNNALMVIRHTVVKNALMSTEKETQYQALLDAEYRIGQRIQAPIAANLRILKNGSVYTAAYDFDGVNGVLEDTNITDARWFYVQHGLQDQLEIVQFRGMKSFNEANLVNFTYRVDEITNIRDTALNGNIRLEYRVHDLAGNYCALQESKLGL